MTDVLVMATVLALAFVPQVLAISWSIAAWRNYFSGIDVLWPVIVALLATGYGIFVPGYTFRKVILILFVCAWALRLATHLFLRLKVSFPKEDARYERLKAKWGSNTNRNFFVFYMLQGLAAILLAVPFWLYIMHPSDTMHWTEIVGMILFVAALTGETIADEQLRRFKSKKENKGKTLTTGLWAYSRHPNYFCEWLIWVAFALMAISAPRSGLAVFAPAVMLVALLRWTGVPANEEQAQGSRGDSYREYQRTTSQFFPRLPRKSET